MPLPQDQVEAGVEQLLRASRPVPEADFVDALERRLLPSPRAERRRSRPRLSPPVLWRAGLAVASLALAALVLSLAGVGPLSPGGTRQAAAGDNCRTTIKRHVVRHPVARVAPGGRLEVRYRSRMVSRSVLDCR
jgi:hypothetical protein